MTSGESPAGPSESTTRRQFLRGALVVWAVAPAGCLGIGSGGGNGDSDGEVNEGQDLVTVQNHEIQEGPFDTYVAGTVKNVNNGRITVEVSVTFLDESDGELSDSSDSQSIEPDKVWQFELEFEGDNADAVADYELDARAEEADG